MRVYARGKLGKTSYLRKIILKKKPSDAVQSYRMAQMMCVWVVVMCAHGLGRWVTTTWVYVREVKNLKNPKGKKLRGKKNREASAVRVTKDNGWGPKHC